MTRPPYGRKREGDETVEPPRPPPGAAAPQKDAVMPARYTIHRDQHLVVTRFEGVVDNGAFVPLYRALLSDPDYRLGMNELADLRAVSRLDLTSSGLEEVRVLTERAYAGSGVLFRSAIVAPTDLSFGIARMYEIFSSDGPEKATVVRTLEEGLAVLGLDDLPPDAGWQRGSAAG